MGSHIPVVNTALNRTMCVDAEMVEQHYTSFFLGWSSASQRITPEETYALTDKYKALTCFDFEVGVLFGRVTSYQGLIYLTTEFSLPKELFKQICQAYD